MSKITAMVKTVVSPVKNVAKKAASPIVADFLVNNVGKKRSIYKPVLDETLDVTGSYYFTTDKGFFHLTPKGIFQVIDASMFGACFWKDYIFCSMNFGMHSLVLRGNKSALSEPGTSFNFDVVYQTETKSSNERIHQVTASDDTVWAANSGKNSLLKIDPEKGEVIEEIFPFLDRFDEPIKYDHNHINSVTGYEEYVLFVAYKAGGAALICLYDGVDVYGYKYKNTGVHDIYLKDDGFLFCDTFGNNMPGEGGSVMTHEGPYDPGFFANGNGYIVRGVAQNNDEMVIGHSHKGERRNRFKGAGSLLVSKNGRVVNEIKIPLAQIYQIVNSNGGFLNYTQEVATVDVIKKKMENLLGAPVYKSKPFIQ